MLNAAACIKANKQNIYQKGLSNQVWYNHLHEHCAITKKKKVSCISRYQGKATLINYVKKGKLGFCF